MSSKRNKLAVLLASSFAASSLLSSVRVHAAQTIGDWEGNSTDGWFDWYWSGGGSANNENPGGLAFGNSCGLNIYNYAFSTVGVTLGKQSLAVTPTNTGADHSQSLSVKLEWQNDSQGNAEEVDGANSKFFEIDCTWNAAQWAANDVSYTNTFLYVNFSNAEGTKTGFMALAPFSSNGSVDTFGYPNWDTANPGYPGGWDPTDFTGVTTRTMIWDYGDYVPASYDLSGTSVNNTSDQNLSQLMGTNPAYLEFILGNVTDATGTQPGTYYYDNARLSNPQISATWVAGQQAQGTGVVYDWGTDTNWNSTMPSDPTWADNGGNAMPGNAGDIVTFGTDIPAGITEIIALNETEDFQISVGTLNFDNPGSSYLLEAGGNNAFDFLTLNGDVTQYTYNQTFADSTMTTVNGSAEINDEAGNHTISAPIYLATNATIAVSNYNGTSDILTISGDISGATGTGITLASDTSASMNGTVVFSGVNTYTGGTTIASGTLIAQTAGSLPNGGSVINNGTLDVYGNETLGASGVSAITGNGTLNIGNGPATVVHLAIGSGAASQGALTIAANSSLDIGNNHMILSDPGGSADATILAYLTAGYNGGGWNGASPSTGSIITSAATGTTYGIGWADGANGGISGISSGQLEIKYTLYGDTNLDGTVNSVDFGTLAANFGTSGKTWDQGAFTYNGTVNSVDFGLLANNFGKSLGSAGDVVTAADWAALDAFAEANGLMSEVPEPASAAMVLMLATGALGYRRRRRQT